jgi:hypothetical protein
MKEAINLTLASLASILIITFPFIGFSGVLISLIYYLFIFLPFIPFIVKMEIGFIEKFVLANFAGLSYSTFTLLLDPVFHIKLTKLVFILIPSAIFIIGLKFKGARK